MKTRKSLKNIFISLTIMLISCFFSQNSLAEDRAILICGPAKIIQIDYIVNYEDAAIVELKFVGDESSRKFSATIKREQKEIIPRIENAFYMNYDVTFLLKGTGGCGYAKDRVKEVIGFRVFHPDTDVSN